MSNWYDPESLDSYLDRHKGRLWAGSNAASFDLSDLRQNGALLRAEWKAEEKKKALHRRQLEQEQKKEELYLLRCQRETQRKKQREEEQERRDPTPFFHPPDFEVSIPYTIRDQPIYVPGGTRRGKSTQLQNIIMHDIMEGQGVAVLDPKRDLLRSIVHALPAQRIVDGQIRDIADDIVYLDIKTPIPINLMDRTSEDTDQVVSEIIYIVTKGDPNLSAAEPLLDSLIRSLLVIPDATLTDAYRFLAQRSKQEELLGKLKAIDRDLYETWNPFPKEGVATLIRRLRPFYWNKGLKAIFDSHSAPLDFAEIMDNKKILLVDLSPPGDKNTSFYGSLIVAQIMSTILQRSAIPKYKRVPFFLHVDEFEFFQTESFARLLSVAGGMGLRFTIGNQYLDQVLPQNLSAILSNAGTYIFFEISKKDATHFDSKIAPYHAARLVQLKPYQACFKIGSEPPIFKWTKRQYVMPEHEEEEADRLLDKLREITVARYRQKTSATSAESSQKRTGENPSSQPPANVVELEDEGRTMLTERAPGKDNQEPR